MARFYARFDSGSAGWVGELDFRTFLNLPGTEPYGFFERRYIAQGSASAALLRTGLIASRSAVSVDMYNELDSVNQNGALGIYFPPDTLQVTNGVLTGSAYTSSVVGVVIPPISSGSVGYLLRPTESILSTQTTLVKQTVPLDSASVTYDVYLSASQAVRTVLDSIHSGSDTSTNRGPYSRLGNNPSRTLHSIWHDPDLQYFAWDDFTPGKPNITIDLVNRNCFIETPDPDPQIPPGPSYITYTIAAVYWGEYFNDMHPLGKIRLQITASDWYGTSYQDTGIIPVTGSNVYSFDPMTFVPTAYAFTSSLGGYVQNTGPDGTIEITASFYDPLISTSQGQISTVSRVVSFSSEC